MIVNMNPFFLKIKLFSAPTVLAYGENKVIDVDIPVIILFFTPLLAKVLLVPINRNQLWLSNPKRGLYLKDTRVSPRTKGYV